MEVYQCQLFFTACIGKFVCACINFFAIPQCPRVLDCKGSGGSNYSGTFWILCNEITIPNQKMFFTNILESNPLFHVFTKNNDARFGDHALILIDNNLRNFSYENCFFDSAVTNSMRLFTAHIVDWLHTIKNSWHKDRLK